MTDTVAVGPPRWKGAPYLRFTTLHKAATGAYAGTARMTLVLGVDKDCDLATGDAGGVDRSATLRVEIDVTTDARSGDDGRRDHGLLRPRARPRNRHLCPC